MNQSRRNVIKNSVAGAAALAISQKVHPKDAATDLDRLDAMLKGSQVIQKARAVGLDLLKPTARELQHGLGLHKESLVFDGYAFAPRASMDCHDLSEQRGKRWPYFFS